MENPGANSSKRSKNFRGKGDEPSDIHIAARNGDLQKVESICMSNPLAVNSRDKHSRTPLHLAAWSGKTEIVNYLCKNKAEVGAAAMDDTCAIHFASQKGHLEVVRTLLLNGASVKAATRKGFTPLHFAAQNSHLDLVKYLIRKGANVNVKTKSGETAIDLAKNEEVKSVLVESEKPQEKGAESKITDDNVVACDAKIEESDVNEKRKGEDIVEENNPGLKKARVSLQHLETEDDTQDGEEE